MNKGTITLIAVGDLIIDRDEPTTIFDHVVNVLRSGDITFANCDQAYSDKGSPYVGLIGGPFYRVLPSDPKNITALVYAGLDVVSFANNHTMDFGPEALLDSIDRLHSEGIQVVGAGKNIAEARQPVILEKKGNRVGFLAYGCVGPESTEATENRAGHVPIRAWTIYKQVDYQPGNPPQIITLAYKDDLSDMEQDIRKLRSQVDVVVVSFHWGLHHIPAQIPMYEFELGHAAIDAGADIILGGHAHILKGIEVYKGKVIFHALNNFAVEFHGRDMNSVKMAIAERAERGCHAYYEPDPEYPADHRQPEARATIIAKVIIERGEIQKVSYVPCYENKKAEPEIVTRSDPKGNEVFTYIEKISRSQNLSTNFVWEGDEVVISAGSM
ncbi:CapA family protein [Chloroflexota bacterium]